MTFFDNEGAPLAQLVNLTFNTAAEDANEGADDENTAQGNDEHSDEKRPTTSVSSHRTCV